MRVTLTIYLAMVCGATIGPVQAASGLADCIAAYRVLDLEDALEACSGSLENRQLPADLTAEAFAVRGLTRLDLGQQHLAIADFSSALALMPGHVEALNGRANAFDEIGETVRAVADYSAAIALDPGFVEAYGNRAIAFLRSGNPDAARSDLEAATRLTPNDPRIATLRQWLLDQNR